ncbi:MAG: hypothetical protein PQJ61_03520 [Spirochaetales bacterium]|uniref:Uncharacterized protein n=1 Tax=Candidatus Thalassospirochaeta sargassi TaxID=3119039 RepID=A0AAJ1IDJ1_9SPIO|nr:hypothetical protein [Spirochaetales bacterium]
MVQYRIKSSKEINNYLNILGERNDGFDVLIINEHDEYRREVKDFLSKELFETCLRTGYLIKLDADQSLMTA